MEEEATDFKQMLNKMKVVEFREKQEDKKIRAIFGQIKRQRQHSYHPHYKMTLYCKAIKGFMVASIRLQTFGERLQGVYINLLLRQHFDAICQFKVMEQEQRSLKIRQVEVIIKKQVLKRFKCNVKQELELRRSQQSAKHEFSRVQEFKYKTDLNFYCKKEPQSNVSKNTGFNRLLEDSIRSAQSPFNANSQFQSKRKFAAVKQLPKMMDLQSVAEHPEKALELRPQIIQFPKVQRQTLLYDAVQPKKHQESLLTFQSKQTIEVDQPQRKKYDKNQILALLSKTKMLQIAQISSIITEYRQTFKQQPLFSQERLLSECKNTLQRIINL